MEITSIVAMPIQPTILYTLPPMLILKHHLVVVVGKPPLDWSEDQE